MVIMNDMSYPSALLCSRCIPSPCLLQYKKKGKLASAAIEHAVVVENQVVIIGLGLVEHVLWQSFSGTTKEVELMDCQVLAAATGLYRLTTKQPQSIPNTQ